MIDALLHPFAQPAKAEADFRTIVRAEGSTLWDDQGRTYIDGMASLWYCQVGHGRTEIIDAVINQIGQLDAYNIFDPFTNEPAAKAAQMIAERSPHPDGRVFLGSSGSEAVDTALKLARQMHQLRGDTDRQIIVRRTHGYHGTNFGGTSAQGLPLNRAGWGDLVPHFIEVPSDDIEALATVFANQGERIAAVITEPLQGAGGVYPPPPGYLEQTRRLCDDNGALLIFDEVICGFGRLGSWFGATYFGVTPDLMTFAKGVTSGYQPMSGVIISRAVAEVFEEPGFLLRTGYTYSGHPAGCAAAIANIELMEADGLLERANHVGAKLREGLEALAGDGLIEQYRGDGAMYAMEIGRESGPVRDDLLDKGVIVRPLGNALVMCPPLVITDAEIGTVFDAIASSLA